MEEQKIKEIQTKLSFKKMDLINEENNIINTYTNTNTNTNDNLRKQSLKEEKGKEDEDNEDDTNDISKDAEELDKILFSQEKAHEEHDYLINTDIRRKLTMTSQILKQQKQTKKDFLLEKNLDVEEKPEFLTVYEFDLSKLERIFNSHPNGNNIMKALYSMWLELCSDIVKKKNNRSSDKERKRRLSMSYFLDK